MELEPTGFEGTKGEWCVLTSRDLFPAIVSSGVGAVCIDIENEHDARMMAASKKMAVALGLAVRELSFCVEVMGCRGGLHEEALTKCREAWAAALGK